MKSRLDKVVDAGSFPAVSTNEFKAKREKRYCDTPSPKTRGLVDPEKTVVSKGKI